LNSMMTPSHDKLCPLSPTDPHCYLSRGLQPPCVPLIKKRVRSLWSRACSSRRSVDDALGPSDGMRSRSASLSSSSDSIGACGATDSAQALVTSTTRAADSPPSLGRQTQTPRTMREPSQTSSGPGPIDQHLDMEPRAATIFRTPPPSPSLPNTHRHGGSQASACEDHY
jgi:hypothetical protein